MGFFSGKAVVDESLPRGDRGMGRFEDFTYGLVAKNKNVTILLGDSDPYQEELRTIVDSGETTAETAISPRSIEQERTDERIVVRLFTGRRVSGPVGVVPRGLESVVDENLRRLDDTVGKARIPARIVQKRGRLRVELLMGDVR